MISCIGWSSLELLVEKQKHAIIMTSYKNILLTTNEGVNQERKKPKLEHENRPLC